MLATGRIGLTRRGSDVVCRSTPCSTLLCLVPSFFPPFSTSPDSSNCAQDLPSRSQVPHSPLHPLSSRNRSRSPPAHPHSSLQVPTMLRIPLSLASLLLTALLPVQALNWTSTRDAPAFMDPGGEKIQGVNLGGWVSVFPPFLLSPPLSRILGRRRS